MGENLSGSYGGVLKYEHVWFLQLTSVDFRIKVDRVIDVKSY